MCVWAWQGRVCVCVVNDSLGSCHLLSAAAAAAVKYFTCLIAGHLLGGNFFFFFLVIALPLPLHITVTRNCSCYSEGEEFCCCLSSFFFFFLFFRAAIFHLPVEICNTLSAQREGARARGLEGGRCGRQFH